MAGKAKSSSSQLSSLGLWLFFPVLVNETDAGNVRGILPVFNFAQEINHCDFAFTGNDEVDGRFVQNRFR